MSVGGSGLEPSRLPKVVMLGAVSGLVFGVLGAWLGIEPLAVATMAGGATGVVIGMLFNRHHMDPTR